MSSLDQLLKSHMNDTESYHNLVHLLTNNKINEVCSFDNKILFLLEQPLRLFDYPQIKENDELEEYTKLEMSLIINKLLEERASILNLFEIMNKERKVSL